MIKKSVVTDKQTKKKHEQMKTNSTEKNSYFGTDSVSSSSFYGTQRFITLLTTTRHLSLLQAW